MLRERKLLLADDSLAIQKVIELTFEDEGMRVVSVGDGRQAVERLEEVQPDIVLADVFMPELNGYQVCERIKRDERFRHIPVILLVGSFEPFNEAEARRVGADDYLTKPFQSIRQMVSKVGSLLSGNKSEDEPNTAELPARATEAKSEAQARRDDLELTTADTAPLPQHLRHEAAEESRRTPKELFKDMQLDDEMIEAKPASEFNSAGQAAAGQQRSTEPFSTRDLADINLEPSAATAERRSQPSASLDEARQEANVFELPSEPSRSSSSAASSDDALLDLDDIVMPGAASRNEADDFILDLQDERETPRPSAPTVETASSSFESAPPFAETNATEIEAGLADDETRAATQPAEFGEAQGATEEQRTGFAFVEESQSRADEFHFYPQGASTPATESAPEAASATESPEGQASDQPSSESGLTPTEELPETFRSEETPAEAESWQPAASTGETNAPAQGQISLSQLSPEAIDAIARRVVEHLSTPVIEQIAWEVVPQLAELLIKRRLEEEGKK